MKMFFDIGANKGDYTRYLLDIGADKVICVEANPGLAKSLESRYKHNNVIVINRAVTNDLLTPVKFYICPECDVISTADDDWRFKSRFSDSNRNWVETTVSPISIDKLIEYYGIPQHIKIDVEGYEYKALLGMTKNYGCQVRFEWAEEKKSDILLSIKYLTDLGYTTFGIVYGDAFNETPYEFMSGDDMINDLNSKLNESRKDLWGMIFALNEGDEYVN